MSNSFHGIFKTLCASKYVFYSSLLSLMQKDRLKPTSSADNLHHQIALVGTNEVKLYAYSKTSERVWLNQRILCRLDQIRNKGAFGNVYENDKSKCFTCCSCTSYLDIWSCKIHTSLPEKRSLPLPLLQKKKKKKTVNS